MIKILRENNNEIKQTPIDCIKGATLLSTEEAENLLTEEERKCQYGGRPVYWWLKSQDEYGDNSVVSINLDGSIAYCGYEPNDNNNFVRPTLILSDLHSSGLSINDVFEFYNNKFRIISQNLALCEEAIGNCAFSTNSYSSDACDYEKSNVKKYVDKWFQDGMLYERDKNFFEGEDNEWSGW